MYIVFRYLIGREGSGIDSIVTNGIFGMIEIVYNCI